MLVEEFYTIDHTGIFNRGFEQKNIFDKQGLRMTTIYQRADAKNYLLNM